MRKTAGLMMLALISIFVFAASAAAQDNHFFVQAEMGKVPPMELVGPVAAKAVAKANELGTNRIFVIGIASRDEEADPRDPIFAGERSRRGVRALRENGWGYDKTIVASTTFGDSGRRGILYIVDDGLTLAKLEEILKGYVTQEDLEDAIEKLKDYVNEQIEGLRTYVDEQDATTLRRATDYTNEKKKSVYFGLDGSALATIPLNGEFQGDGWSVAGGEIDLEIVLAKKKRFPSLDLQVAGYLGEDLWRVDAGVGMRAFDVLMGGNVHFSILPSFYYSHTTFDFENGNEANATTDGGGLRVKLPFRFQWKYVALELAPFAGFQIDRLALDDPEVKTNEETGEEGVEVSNLTTLHAGLQLGLRF